MNAEETKSLCDNFSKGFQKTMTHFLATTVDSFTTLENLPFDATFP